MKHILAFYFLFVTCFTFSQQSKIDSLLSLIKTDKPDSSKVQHLNDLAWEISFRNPDTAIVLSKEALQLATDIAIKIETKWNNANIKQSIQTDIGQSYNQLGAFHYYKADYFISLQFFQKALNVWEQLQKLQIQKTKILNHKSSTLSNIGLVYSEQGDYAKALGYFFSALKIAEELGDKNGIAAFLGNIGIVFHHQKDYPKALEYYSRALKIAEELEDKNGMAIYLGNIGVIYSEQGNYPKALDFYFKALKIDEEIGNKICTVAELGKIGVVFHHQKHYHEALDYYFKALKMAEELGDKNRIAIWLGNIGSLYTDIKKYTEAEKYLLNALKIDKEIGALDGEKNIEEALTELYEKTGNYKKALEHYKKSIVAKDSLYNEEKHKEITRKEMNFEFEKKEAAAKVEQEKKDLKKDLITGFALSLLMLVLAFLLFAFRSLRVTTKQTFLIISNFLGTFISRPKIFRNKDTNI